MTPAVEDNDGIFKHEKICGSLSDFKTIDKNQPFVGSNLIIGSNKGNDRTVPLNSLFVQEANNQITEEKELLSKRDHEFIYCRETSPNGFPIENHSEEKLNLIKVGKRHGSEKCIEETFSHQIQNVNNSPTFKCNICNRVYNYRSSLIKHNKVKHNIAAEKKFKCSECPSQFNNIYNLNAHKKRKHPKIILDYDQHDNEIEAKKKTILCNLCGRKFSHLSGLSYHKKKKHGLVVDRPFKCMHCEAKYAMKRSLQMHLYRKHSIPTLKPLKSSKPSVNCVLCSMSFSTNALLCKHYTDAHQICIESENREFSSFNQFLDWKQNLEKKTKEKFILERGCQISKTKIKKHRYLCHRTGYFVRKGAGCRKLKNQGSKKINAHCPAMMVISEHENGFCKAFIVKTHVGHAADLCHISLTPVERSQIASQIAAKVPFEDILDKIKQSVANSPSERLHLLKRKDLHNIEKEFNLSGDSMKHQNDAVSIHTWINDSSNQVDPSVLFYKAQGQVSDTSENFLKVDDLVLILMNNAQSEVLSKYCRNKIIVDGTHTCGNDFYLITLMTINDIHHSFPAAFLISSRIDEEIIFLFFYQIKLKVGTITTNVFVSNVEELFYTAWVKVMGEPQPCFRLWSLWHVDATWRKNIKLLVNDGNQQAEIYKVLRVLLQEKNTDSFMKTLNNFIEYMTQNVCFTEFNSYFSTFVTFATHWASCFRTKCGINDDTHLERMHRTLRHIFVKGKRLKGLDKVIQALMKLVNDQLYYHNLILQRGNVNTKISIIKNRHLKSISLPINSVIECARGWQVPALSDEVSEIFVVSKNSKRNVCACKLFCLDCQTCIHIYRCECIDSSILGNMCEHIHLVCRYFREKQSPAPPESQITASENLSNLIEVDSYEIFVMPEEPNLNAPMQVNDSVPQLMQRKENVINLFLEAVNSVSNFEEMAVVERSTSNMVNSLATVHHTYGS